MPSLVLFQFMQIGSVEYSCLWLWNHKRNFQVGVSPVARLHLPPSLYFAVATFSPIWNVKTIISKPCYQRSLISTQLKDQALDEVCGLFSGLAFSEWTLKSRKFLKMFMQLCKTPNAHFEIIVFTFQIGGKSCVCLRENLSKVTQGFTLFIGGGGMWGLLSAG